MREDIVDEINDLTTKKHELGQAIIRAALRTKQADPRARAACEKYREYERELQTIITGGHELL